MSIMKFYEIFTCHPTNPPLNPKQKPKYDYLTMCRLYTGTDSSKSPVLLEFDQGDGMLWSRAQFPDVPWKLLIQPWVSGANDIQWQHPNLMQLLKQPLSWSGLKQNQVPRTKSHVLAWSNQLTNRVTSCANKTIWLRSSDPVFAGYIPGWATWAANLQAWSTISMCVVKNMEDGGSPFCLVWTCLRV